MLTERAEAHRTRVREASDQKFAWALAHWHIHPSMHAAEVISAVRQKFGGGISEAELKRRWADLGRAASQKADQFMLVHEGCVLELGDARAVGRKLGEEMSKLGIFLYRCGVARFEDLVGAAIPVSAPPRAADVKRVSFPGREALVGLNVRERSAFKCQWAVGVLEEDRNERRTNAGLVAINTTKLNSMVYKHFGERLRTATVLALMRHHRETPPP